MAVMVAHSGVSSSRKRRFFSSAGLVAAGAAAAAAVGGMVGALGAVFPPVPLAVLVTLAACALLAGISASERPWQIDRETPGVWLAYHDWRTIALNGAALGAGFGTRIGYWAWYLLPLGAFALAKPHYGAAILSIFAVARLALSVGVTTRLRPGSVTAWRERFAGALDPVAVLLLSTLLFSTWLEALSTT